MVFSYGLLPGTSSAQHLISLPGKSREMVWRCWHSFYEGKRWCRSGAMPNVPASFREKHLPCWFPGSNTGVSTLDGEGNATLDSSWPFVPHP